MEVAGDGMVALDTSTGDEWVIESSGMDPVSVDGSLDATWLVDGRPGDTLAVRTLENAKKVTNDARVRNGSFVKRRTKKEEVKDGRS